MRRGKRYIEGLLISDVGFLIWLGYYIKNQTSAIRNAVILFLTAQFLTFQVQKA